MSGCDKQKLGNHFDDALSSSDGIEKFVIDSSIDAFFRVFCVTNAIRTLLCGSGSFISSFIKKNFRRWYTEWPFEDSGNLIRLLKCKLGWLVDAEVSKVDVRSQLVDYLAMKFIYKLPR